MKLAEEKSGVPTGVAAVSGVVGGDAVTLVSDSMDSAAAVVRSEIGQYASLGKAIAAARHAVEEIDPALDSSGNYVPKQV